MKIALKAVITSKDGTTMEIPVQGTWSPGSLKIEAVGGSPIVGKNVRVEFPIPESDIRTVSLRITPLGNRKLSIYSDLLADD